MEEFRFGPVELYLVGFEGEAPDAETFAALSDLIDDGVVRVLDFVLVSKSTDGEIIILDVEDSVSSIAGAEPVVPGLAGEEDVHALADALMPGRSAAIVVLELLFARRLAQDLAASGGSVLRSERVPAPVVNAMVDILEQEGA